MTHTPINERVNPVGHFQKIYRFDNNYGASVVQGAYTYGGSEGLWELAVIKFDDDGKWDLCYDTPITDDVLGWLSWSEIETLLDRIKEL